VNRARHGPNRFRNDAEAVVSQEGDGITTRRPTGLTRKLVFAAVDRYGEALHRYGTAERRYGSVWRRPSVVKTVTAPFRIVTAVIWTVTAPLRVVTGTLNLPHGR
jgi:hypothetical protein